MSITTYFYILPENQLNALVKAAVVRFEKNWWGRKKYIDSFGNFLDHHCQYLNWTQGWWFGMLSLYFDDKEVFINPELKAIARKVSNEMSQTIDLFTVNDKTNLLPVLNPTRFKEADLQFFAEEYTDTDVADESGKLILETIGILYNFLNTLQRGEILLIVTG